MPQAMEEISSNASGGLIYAKNTAQNPGIQPPTESALKESQLNMLQSLQNESQ